DAQRAIAAVREELIGGGGGRAWKFTPDEKLHVTLRFLGEIAHGDDVLPAIEAAAHTNVPFSVTLNEIGCFPPRGAPRVLWVGLRSEESRLEELAAALDLELELVGFPPEDRPFTPHITIAR